MIFILSLLVILIGAGVWEYRRHQTNVSVIPTRVHVNGTRGKSSVTRLIAGGLRGGRLRTLAKTTGTKPRLIYPDGSEVPINRVGKANIIEQLMVLRRAVAWQADVLVVECMAVLPPNQQLAEKQMIRSTVGVITNVRADHLDEMGPTVEDVARSLSNTVPYGGTLFTCEEKYLYVFQEIAARRKTEVRLVKSEHITDEMMKGFSYLEHKDNVALALAVAEHLGVSTADALSGMHHAIPDPGVLRIFKIHYYEKEIEFVNAFAANDPDSYVIIWSLLKPYFTAEKKVIAVVNCRKDRIQRTESLAELIAKNLSADHFMLVGEFTDPLYNRAIALGLPASRVSNLSDESPEDVFHRVVAMTEGSSLVIGVGNIVGHGEELLLSFTNRGKELVY